MPNNIVLRLFFAIIIISSIARAAETELSFEILSDPSYKMSALKRAGALFSLSEKSPELAEQCLNEVMSIAKGKYGLAKKRSASTEERTVVGKAIAALKRLYPTRSNPFEKQEGVGEVDDVITRHLTVLKGGFDHIADLMSAEITPSIEVFGISFEVAKPTIIVTEAVELLETEQDEGSDGERVVIVIDESLVDKATTQQPARKLSNAATDGGEEEEEGLGVFESGDLSIAALHKGKDSSRGIPTGKTKRKPKSDKAAAKGKPTGEGAEEVENGQGRNSHRAIAGHDNSIVTTGLESAEVVVQLNGEGDTAAQEAERKRKEEEDARSKHSGTGGIKSPSNVPQQPSSMNGASEVTASDDQHHAADESEGEEGDEVVPKDNCCKRKRKKSCVIC